MSLASIFVGVPTCIFVTGNSNRKPPANYLFSFCRMEQVLLPWLSLSFPLPFSPKTGNSPDHELVYFCKVRRVTLVAKPSSVGILHSQTGQIVHSCAKKKPPSLNPPLLSPQNVKYLLRVISSFLHSSVSPGNVSISILILILIFFFPLFPSSLFPSWGKTWGWDKFLQQLYLLLVS